MTAEFPYLEDLQSHLRDVEATGHDRAGELLGHIEAYVDDGADERSLREALSEGVAAFEADHPRLASLLQRVVDSLTAGGI